MIKALSTAPPDVQTKQGQFLAEDVTRGSLPEATAGVLEAVTGRRVTSTGRWGLQVFLGGRRGEETAQQGDPGGVPSPVSPRVPGAGRWPGRGGAAEAGSRITLCVCQRREPGEDE